MNNTHTMNRNFEVIAWGCLFIWWGITELFNSLPDGTGAIGIGLILIGMNVARLSNGLPASRHDGGDAFDERIYKFNRSMNCEYRLSKWFVKEFGSTQCQAITHCDFSESTGVSSYVEGDLITKCKTIASKVAEKVRTILAY